MAMCEFEISSFSSTVLHVWMLLYMPASSRPLTWDSSSLKCSLVTNMDTWKTNTCKFSQFTTTRLTSQVFRHQKPSSIVKQNPGLAINPRLVTQPLTLNPVFNAFRSQLPSCWRWSMSSNPKSNPQSPPSPQKPSCSPHLFWEGCCND